MPLTPETLTRHELNGLPVAVVDSPNPDLVGIAGRVVVETMRTLHVDTGATGPRHAGDDEAGEADGESRVRQVPKEGTTFEFRLPATATPTETTSTTDDRHADDPSPVAAAGRHDTDEAAGAAKAPGTASKPVSDPEEPATDLDSTDENEDEEAARAEAGEGAAYVTVDGTRLLSRPALRTENAGETTWR
jgi:ribonuclease P protein subunit POP4